MKAIYGFLLVCALGVMLASAATAVPIDYVSAFTLGTSFDSSTGVLLLEDTRPLYIYYSDSSDDLLTDVSLHLNTTLATDESQNGLVNASFSGGELSLVDAQSNPLLTGTVESLTLAESAETEGILIAEGIFSVTSGSLMSDWQAEQGAIFNMIFTTTPANVSDMSVSFSGASDLSLAPIPEPITLSIFGLGLAGLVYRRKRS